MPSRSKVEALRSFASKVRCLRREVYWLLRAKTRSRLPTTTYNYPQLPIGAQKLLPYSHCPTVPSSKNHDNETMRQRDHETMRIFLPVGRDVPSSHCPIVPSSHRPKTTTTRQCENFLPVGSVVSCTFQKFYVSLYDCMRACVICVHAWACNEQRKATATTQSNHNNGEATTTRVLRRNKIKGKYGFSIENHQSILRLEVGQRP